MSDAIGPTELDALVAAIITPATTVISPDGRVQAFKDVLQALVNQGGARTLVGEAREAAPPKG